MLIKPSNQRYFLKRKWCFTAHCTFKRLLFYNTLRPRQNGRRFADDVFKYIFLNENVRILIKISLKFIPKSPINNIPALIQIMAWGRSGDKPLSEPMTVSLMTHICVTRPQWDNRCAYDRLNYYSVNGLLHIVHLNRLSLVWTRIWVVKRNLRENILLYIVYQNGIKMTS